MLINTRRSLGVTPFAQTFATFGYSVFCLVVLGALAELASFVLISIRHRKGPNPMSLSPAYVASPWAKQFWIEESERMEKQKFEDEPFRVWGNARWHGQFVNTDETDLGLLRRTINPVHSGCGPQKAVTIWIFGSSVVFGSGNPDSTTIASSLSRVLNAIPGGCFVVQNLGVEGYVTNQELILLIEELKEGRRPDIAVFFDGMSDSALGAFMPLAHRSGVEHLNTANQNAGILGHFYSVDVAQRLLDRLKQPKPKITHDEIPARAKATLQNYEANLRLIQELAIAHGFKVNFFWQPVLAYGSKPVVPFERGILESLRQDSQGQVVEAIKGTYQEAADRSRATSSFVFLGNIFDRCSDPIYTDVAHLGPLGNELVAEAIAQRIGTESVRKSAFRPEVPVTK